MKTTSQPSRKRTKSVAKHEVIETGVAHFRIAGEDLTRIAREVLLSDQPNKAWRLLSAGLCSENKGESEYAARHILDGAMKLTGDEAGMDIEPDNDSSAYREQVKYIYAGRVRIGPSWMRPRAKIDGLNELDASFAMGTMEGSIFHTPGTPGEARAVTREFARRRGQFYAREGERALHVDVKGELLLVLFEPVSEPPFWWPEQTDPAKAVEEFLAVGRVLSLDGTEVREQRPQLKLSSRPRMPPLRDKKQEEADEARWAAEDLAAKQRLESFRSRIIEQAGENVFDLRDKDGTVVAQRVPRAPFEQWALRRTSLKHLAQPWTPVSPSGMKLPMDDPFHTDWYLAAVGDLDSVYDRGPFHNAAIHECVLLQERLGDFQCGVITDGGGEYVSGTVGTEIIVLPDLHPDRLEMMLKARGVITEAGGQLAHLAQVAMERSIPIMLMPDATRVLREGMEIAMEPRTGRIHIFVLHT